MKSRVGILGGTFDPVHCGHVRIAHSFLTSGLIEELLILLSPDPPHKQNRNTAHFSHRLAMLKLAFSQMENVRISDLEKKLEKPSYTLRTIQFLQQKYPDTLFYLCIGEDSLQNFYEWYQYQNILKRVNLLVAERPGFNRSEVDSEILESAIFVDHEPYEISSTGIRNSIDHLKKEVPDAVADYIIKNHLYG